MDDFICLGLLELQGTQSKRENLIQNEIFLPTVGFEPVTFRIRRRRVTDCTTISDIHLKYIMTYTYTGFPQSLNSPRILCFP